MKRRQEILTADEFTSYEKLSDLRVEADKPLDFLRFLGGCGAGVFFEGGTASAKERRRADLSLTIRDYLNDAIDMPTRLVLRSDIEQPVSVLARTGAARCRLSTGRSNSPRSFWRRRRTDRCGEGRTGVSMRSSATRRSLGRTRWPRGTAKGYPDWLKTVHPESHGNADLVAHFFRRAFDLIRSGGAFGLIATNTIGQGDTRSTGLRWICNHGGTIYAARKRLKWPGEAAVVVSVVHVSQRADRRPVRSRTADRSSLITAYLFHAGGHDDPERLHANAGKSFHGKHTSSAWVSPSTTPTRRGSPTRSPVRGPMNSRGPASGRSRWRN